MVDPDRRVSRRARDAGGQTRPGGPPRRVGRGQDQARRSGRRCPRAHASLERQQPVVPQQVDLAQQLLRRTRVVQPHVRGTPPGGVIGLRRHPGLGVPRAHPPPGDHTAHPFLGAGVDDDGQVVPVLVAELDQQRDVVDHDGGLRCGREPPLGEGTDQGVGDGLQPGPRLGIPEHQPTQRRPVQAPVGRSDARAEGGGDRGQAGAARRHHFSRQQVGVDDHRTTLGQAPGDGRLARPDAARQPHPQHPRESGTVPHRGSCPDPVPGRTTTTRPPVGDGPSVGPCGSDRQAHRVSDR